MQMARWRRYSVLGAVMAITCGTFIVFTNLGVHELRRDVWTAAHPLLRVSRAYGLCPHGNVYSGSTTITNTRIIIHKLHTLAALRISMSFQMDVVVEAKHHDATTDSAPPSTSHYLEGSGSHNAVTQEETLNYSLSLHSQSPPARATLSYLSLMDKLFPKYMIIGFGKAGTKALYEALKLHPSLSGPYREERFFSEHFDIGLPAYLRSLPLPPPGGYTIEKSPDYIIHPLAAQRISDSAAAYGLNPGLMKFIVVLRHPIHRAMSEYLEWQIQRRYKVEYRGAKAKPLLPFTEMVLERDKSVNGDVVFLNTSCYAHHIRRWLRVFSPEQMCYVDGDLFIRRPYDEVKRLEKCMGLVPFFVPKHFVFEKTKGFYCFVEGSKKLCMGGSKGRKHPPIPADVMDKLMAFFQPWNQQLLNITGREFPSWI